jgi:hypothetical protein
MIVPYNIVFTFCTSDFRNIFPGFTIYQNFATLSFEQMIRASCLRRFTCPLHADLTRALTWLAALSSRPMSGMPAVTGARDPTESKPLAVPWIVDLAVSVFLLPDIPDSPVARKDEEDADFCPPLVSKAPTLRLAGPFLSSSLFFSAERLVSVHYCLDGNCRIYIRSSIFGSRGTDIRFKNIAAYSRSALRPARIRSKRYIAKSFLLFQLKERNRKWSARRARIFSQKNISLMKCFCLSRSELEPSSYTLNTMSGKYH